MAATTPRVTAFWGAFLNVLVRCIAALGFATPARLRAATSGRTACSATVPAQGGATTSQRAAAPVGGYAPPPPPAGRVMLPAPRSSERGRSLPPTMKQRIRAEAHGTSPSDRCVALPVEGIGDAVAAAATSSAASATAAGKDDTEDRAGRRRDRALRG